MADILCPITVNQRTVAVIDDQELIALHRAAGRIIHQIVKSVHDVRAVIEQFYCHNTPVG